MTGHWTTVHTYDSPIKSYLWPFLEVMMAVHTNTNSHIITFRALDNQLPFMTVCRVLCSCDHDFWYFWLVSGLYFQFPAKNVQLRKIDLVNNHHVHLMTVAKNVKKKRIRSGHGMLSLQLQWLATIILDSFTVIIQGLPKCIWFVDWRQCMVNWKLSGSWSFKHPNI